MVIVGKINTEKDIPNIANEVKVEDIFKQAGAELCQAQAQVGLPAENRLN